MRLTKPANWSRWASFGWRNNEAFREAETFLWAVRCHMHHNAGRPVEQLTFDIQVGVADRMRLLQRCFIPRGGRRGGRASLVRIISSNGSGGHPAGYWRTRLTAFFPWTELGKRWRMSNANLCWAQPS